MSDRTAAEQFEEWWVKYEQPHRHCSRYIHAKDAFLDAYAEATERAAQIAETYPWLESHVYHLKIRGETEIIGKIAQAIRG